MVFDETVRNHMVLGYQVLLIFEADTMGLGVSRNVMGWDGRCWHMNLQVSLLFQISSVPDEYG